MKSVFSVFSKYGVTTTAQVAQVWLDKGYVPMPVVSGQKKPRYMFHAWDLLAAEGETAQHWEKHPQDDIALRTDDGLIVLDADTEESRVAIERLEQQFNCATTMRIKTARGVHHYYKGAPGLSLRSAGYSSENTPERIDIRCGKNCYAITAPSTGKEMIGQEIVSFGDLPVMEQDFADAVMRHNGVEFRQARLKEQEAAVDTQGISEEDQRFKLEVICEMLTKLSPDLGYDDWRAVLMAVHHETQGSDEGLALVQSWSAHGQSYPGDRDMEKKWKGFDTGHSSPNTLGTILKLVKDAGFSPMDVISEVSDRLCGFEVTNTVVVTSLKSDGFGKSPLRMDRALLPHQPNAGSNGVPGTVENFIAIMNHYGVVIKYNMISKIEEITVPYLQTTKDNAQSATNSHVRSLCALNGFPTSSIGTSILAMADLHAFNPVAEWVKSKPWDGVDRLQEMYDTVSVSQDYPNDFKEALMKRWFISAVASVMKSDGFRSRGVLTFSGKQGLGKTSWINALVDDVAINQYILTGQCLDPNQKDSVSTSVSHWIVELGEVESTLKRDIAALKAFLTKDVDTFRRPYAVTDSSYPRRTVFAASVNDTNFLIDPTGNSRWWTISVESINFDHGIQMQQLWAQVYEQLFDKGEQWWLTPEEERQLAEINAEHEAQSLIAEGMAELLNRGLERGDQIVFHTAKNLLKAIGNESPTNAQFKEANQVLTQLMGKPRKTRGVKGWDFPYDGYKDL